MTRGLMPPDASSLPPETEKRPARVAPAAGDSRLVAGHIGLVVRLTLLAGLLLLGLGGWWNGQQVGEQLRVTAREGLQVALQQGMNAQATVTEVVRRLPYRRAELRDGFGRVLASAEIPPRTTFWSLLFITDTEEPDELNASNGLSLRAYVDAPRLAAQAYSVNMTLALMTALWLVVFALLLSYGFVRRLTRPVEELARRLYRVDPARPRQSLLPLPAQHKRDEVGLIIRAVNQLLVRLDESLTREQTASDGMTERETQLLQVFDGVADGILVLGDNLAIRRTNKAAGLLLGRTYEQLTKMHFEELLDIADRQGLPPQLAKLTAGSEPLSLTLAVHQPDGSALTIDLRASRFASAHRNGIVVVFRDVSASRRAQDELKRSEERLQLAVKATRSAVWDYDVVEDSFWWSAELLAMLDYTTDELAPSLESKYALIHEEDVKWVRTSMERYLAKESTEYNPEFRMKRKDGSWLWVEDHATAEWDAEGRPVRMSGIMRDCSERKRFESQLMYMATHDPMTDLPNRTLLLDRLDHALRHASRNKLMVAALLIDIDRFKLINESLGHEIGDQLVRAVAQRLKQSLRPSDTLSRLAVDEFVVVCEDLPSPQEAARVAKRLLSSLSQHFLVEGNQLFISVSIGISISPSDGTTPQEILRHADTAMQNAKANGGHCHRFFISDMDKDAVSRLTMERQLIEAVERQQFVLHYQPKIDIASGKPMGFEALIRWPHKVLGNITPLQFVPVAEETGQIIAIGEWVIREALSQICAWRERGFVPLPVAVNISGKQLMAGGVDELILRLLREYEVSPELLEIEITESAVMTKMEKILPVLQHLREAGVGISLDDFGTGYSSLSYLRQMPISTLKIDRSFIKDVPNKPEANSIAGVIMAVGQQLGLKVVAEGIETEEQLAFLRDHKCDSAQGWLFHKALTPAKAEELLARKAS